MLQTYNKALTQGKFPDAWKAAEANKLQRKFAIGIIRAHTTVPLHTSLVFANEHPPTGPDGEGAGTHHGQNTSREKRQEA